jgi:hypothetical protein
MRLSERITADAIEPAAELQRLSGSTTAEMTARVSGGELRDVLENGSDGPPNVIVEQENCSQPRGV